MRYGYVRQYGKFLVPMIAVAGLLANCGNASQTSEGTSSAAAETSTQEASYEPAAQEVRAESASEEPSSSENAADFADVREDQDLPDPDPIEVTLGDMTLEVPGYYTLDEDKSEDNELYYEYNTFGDVGAALILCEKEENASKTQFLDSRESMRQYADGIFNTEGQDASITMTDFQETEYRGMPGYSANYTGTASGNPTTCDMDMFLDDATDHLYVFLFLKVGDPERDVAADYGTMMKNAVIQTGTASDSEEESKDTKQSAGEDGVDPKVRETLDSYEAMMNDYCDFMEKYQNADASESASMLNDYYAILDEYTTAMSKLSDLDTTEMSTADYEYYLDVTNRVNKRMLEVTGNN